MVILINYIYNSEHGAFFNFELISNQPLCTNALHMQLRQCSWCNILKI